MSHHDPHAPYTLYKMDISYFSGKLEAYLRNKGIAYTTATGDAAALDMLYARTGVKKVPALHSADDLWLFDTTPTIRWLEQRYPDNPATPPDPAQAFLATLIEDYADEWLWRPAMWWRWEPLASRRALGRRIADEVRPAGIPRPLMAWFFPHRQRRTWLWGDGMDKSNAAAVRDLYLQELDFLQAVLTERAYLLGDQPSLADYGYFASMFRHFGNDPDPAEIMRRRAPAVYEWLARMWNAPRTQASTPRWLAADGPYWAALWTRICGDYLPYLSQNAAAWAAGKKRFNARGASLSFNGTLTHHYRVWCLQVLRRAWRELDAEARAQITSQLAPYGGLAALDSGADVDAGLDALYTLPKPPGQHKAGWRITLLGQPRN